MLEIIQIKSSIGGTAEQNTKYLVAEFERSQGYYESGTRKDDGLFREELTPRIVGTGCEILKKTYGVEITGKLTDKNLLVNLAEGKIDLKDGTTKQLVRKSNKKQNVIAYDCTFSADKTISELFSNGNPTLQKQILELQNRSAEAAIKLMEGKLKVHSSNNRHHDQKVAGVVCSLFTHLEARATDENKTIVREADNDTGEFKDTVKNFGDCQIHTHAELFNIGVLENGKTYSLDNRQLFEAKMEAGAFYRFQMSKGIQELGYEVEAYTLKKDTYFRVKGVEQFAEAMSTRSKEMFESTQMSKDEYDALDSEAKSQIAIQTRKNKKDENVELTLNQLMTAFKNKGDEIGLTENLITSLQKNPNEITLLEKTDGKEIQIALTQFDNQIIEKDIAKEFWVQNTGTDMTTEQVLLEIEKTKKELAPYEIHHKSQTAYANPLIVAEEAKLLELVKPENRYKENAPWTLEQANLESVKEAFEKDKNATLTPSQEEAFFTALQNKSNVSVIEGRAGSGKSFMMDACRIAFEGQGVEVRGVAQNWVAANGLSESANMDSESIAKMIKNFMKQPLKANSVVFCDEAGLVGSEDMSKLIAHVNAHGAKIVLVGDTNQLSPVASGSALFEVKKAIEAVNPLENSKMTHVSRQKTEASLTLANLMAEELPKATKNVDKAEKKETLRTEYKKLVLKLDTDLKKAFDTLEAKDIGREEVRKYKKEIKTIYNQNLKDAEKKLALDIDKVEKTKGRKEKTHEDVVVEMKEILNREGWLNIKEDKNELKLKLVDDVFKDKASNEKFSWKEIAIMSVSNDNVNALNNLIVKERLKLGELDSKEKITFKVDLGKNNNENGSEKTFYKNDRVIFLKNLKPKDVLEGSDNDVANGINGTITKIENGKITVLTDTNKTVVFEPKTLNKLNHAYAQTITKSQGKTVNFAYLLDEFTSRGALYVGLSRNRLVPKVYTTPKDLEKWNKLDTIKHKDFGLNKLISTETKAKVMEQAKLEVNKLTIEGNKALDLYNQSKAVKVEVKNETKPVLEPVQAIKTEPKAKVLQNKKQVVKVAKPKELSWKEKVELKLQKMADGIDIIASKLDNTIRIGLEKTNERLEKLDEIIKERAKIELDATRGEWKDLVKATSEILRDNKAEAQAKKDHQFKKEYIEQLSNEFNKSERNNKENVLLNELQKQIERKDLVLADLIVSVFKDDLKKSDFIIREELFEDEDEGEVMVMKDEPVNLLDMLGGEVLKKRLQDEFGARDTKQIEAFKVQVEAQESTRRQNESIKRSNDNQLESEQKLTHKNSPKIKNKEMKRGGINIS